MSSFGHNRLDISVELLYYLIDNDLLINSYCTEVKYKFLSISKNKTKDENYWANDLKEKCKTADIIFLALGRANFLKKEDITANLMKIREIRECQITEIGSRSN